MQAWARQGQAQVQWEAAPVAKGLPVFGAASRRAVCGFHGWQGWCSGWHAALRARRWHVDGETDVDCLRLEQPGPPDQPKGSGLHVEAFEQRHEGLNGAFSAQKL